MLCILKPTNGGTPEYSVPERPYTRWITVDNAGEEALEKRIDTHSHPKMSKHFQFSPASVDSMVRQGRRVGLDAIALTEHFHATRYWDIHNHLEATFPCDRGVFRADGFALIPGAEVNIREGAHIIVLGEVPELRRLDGAFPSRLSERYEPTLREFLDVTDDFDIVRIGAHIFRRCKELGKFSAVDLRRLHALEINGKDFGTEIMLLAQARALGLPIVAGSDAHHWLQIGVRHTLVHTDEITVHAITKTIKEGLTGFATGSYTPLRVKAAKSLKNITKLLRKCYGGFLAAPSPA
jgi:predicted metal-dependent phosphoesterase TrpH